MDSGYRLCFPGPFHRLLALPPPARVRGQAGIANQAETVYACRET